MKALLHGDQDLASRVVDQDRQIDALRRDLSASARARDRQAPAHGPATSTEVLADFRIVEDLERIGDLAKNIAIARHCRRGNDVFPATW